MTRPLPSLLPSLVSQVLIAFTLEFDALTLRSQRFEGYPGATLAMWSNLLRFLEAGSVEEKQLKGLSGVLPIHSMALCLERHGWVDLETSRKGSVAKIALSESGRRLQVAWRPLLWVHEECWSNRFGKEEMGQLRDSLEGVVRQVGAGLPYYPMFAAGARWRGSSKAGAAEAGDAGRPAYHPLFVLLSQTLIAFIIDFDREMAAAAQGFYDFFPMYSNVLRLLSEDGLSLAELQERSGISKPVITILLRQMEKNGWGVVEGLIETGAKTTSKSRKQVRLTGEGREVQEKCQRNLELVEQLWEDRFGSQTIQQLRRSLNNLLSHLDDVLIIAPGSEQKVTLPHCPVAMAHRGGTPTGL